VSSAILNSTKNYLSLLIRRKLKASPLLAEFRNRFCQTFFRYKQSDFRLVDNVLSMFESILEVDGIFPKFRDIGLWCQLNYSRYNLSTDETEKLACRDIMECMTEASSQLQPFIGEFYNKLKEPFPVIWRVMIDSTGSKGTLHTSCVSIAPLIPAMAKSKLTCQVTAIKKCKDSRKCVLRIPVKRHN